MLESALVLASKGYPVFPVRLCQTACLKCDLCKAPASPHGFHDATLDARANPNSMETASRAIDWSTHGQNIQR